MLDNRYSGGWATSTPARPASVPGSPQDLWEQQQRQQSGLPPGFGGGGGGGTPRPQDRELPYFNEDRQRLQGLLGGQSPFASDAWGSYITGLQNRAKGVGPSPAQDAYRTASMDSSNHLGSMARNSMSASAARGAMGQQAGVTQGMAQGLNTAKTAEMQQSQQALQQALGTRDSINQDSYLNLLAKQLGMSVQQLQSILGNRQAGLRDKQAQDQKDAGTWSTIGGLVGGVGGFVVGGPGGALAGYQAGKMAGGQLGS